MCGICGIASTRGTVDPGRLEAMGATIAQRGPDSDGYLVGRVGLAADASSIIDLAAATSRSGTRTVGHGRPERRDLQLSRAPPELERGGTGSATSSDTEVLVHLYEEHGERFAERLRGMFAVALWDPGRGGSCSHATVRDQAAVLPRGRRRARSHPSCGRCRAARSTSTRSRRSSRSTPFRRRYDLPRGASCRPGTSSTWEDGGSSPPLRAARSRSGGGGAPRRAECRGAGARLRDSVRAHLVADVPVGVLLSGGVDSAVVAAFAARGGRPLRTFSIGFEEAGSTSCRGPARRRAVRAHHGELVTPARRGAAPPRARRGFDEPFADSSALPTYLVSRLAAEDVKVALSGEGGDELFGGYYTYAADLLAERAAPTARCSARWSNGCPRRAPGQASTTRRSGSCAPRTCPRSNAITAGRRSSRRTRGPSSPADAPASTRSTSCVRASRRPRAPGCSRGSRTSTSALFLVDDLLVKTDRASMAHSLEARVPFLDPP